MEENNNIGAHNNSIVIGVRQHSEESNELTIGFNDNTIRFKPDGRIIHNGSEIQADSNLVNEMINLFRLMLKENM